MHIRRQLLYGIWLSLYILQYCQCPHRRQFYFCFILALQPNTCYGLLIHKVFLDHTQPGLLWTSDQLVAETSTWQHTTFTTDELPCPPVGFEPTISAGERPQIYALDPAATGIGDQLCRHCHCQVFTVSENVSEWGFYFFNFCWFFFK